MVQNVDGDEAKNSANDKNDNAMQSIFEGFLAELSAREAATTEVPPAEKSAAKTEEKPVEAEEKPADEEQPAEEEAEKPAEAEEEAEEKPEEAEASD